MGLALTRHSIERYQERVKPALALGACEEEIHRLAIGARIEKERPFPVPADIEAEDRLGNPEGWMELFPGIWGVLRSNGRGRWLMVSVITEGISPKRRARRNEARSRSRARRQRRRREYVFSQGKRRTRIDRWQ